jgi:hypothetical protein
VLCQAAPGGARAEVEYDEAWAAFVAGVDDVGYALDMLVSFCGEESGEVLPGLRL